MKAPEKLYFPIDDALETYARKDSDEEIEYICADVFFKKVKEAFCKATCNGNPPRDTCTSLGTCRDYDNFIKLIYKKEE